MRPSASGGRITTTTTWFLWGRRRLLTFVGALLAHWDCTGNRVGVLAVTQPAFDCTARLLAYDTASIQLSSKSGPPNPAMQLKYVSDALRLHECDSWRQRQNNQEREKLSNLRVSRISDWNVYVATSGSDENDGSAARPFATIRRAVETARLIDNDRSKTIRVMTGRYYQADELTLGPEDTGLTIMAYPPGAIVIISGAAEQKLTFAPVSASALANFPPGTLSAHIPESSPLPKSAVYQDFGQAIEPKLGDRLVLAREPNGNPETDLQPTGYAAAAGGFGGSGPSDKGSIYSIVDTPRRNNSVYPIFGRDWDPRDLDKKGNIIGWQWRHLGGTARRFGDSSCFFNGTVPMGMHWNSSASKDRGGHEVSPFNANNWTVAGAKGALAHVFHPAFWGNWVFEVDSYNASNKSLSFGRGGFQEAHGGGIGKQPFYVEGVRETLDQKGEFWIDRSNRKMYLLPNSTKPVQEDTVISILVPSTRILLGIRGKEGDTGINAQNIRLEGLTFAFSSPTFLDDYIVPSPGDWSIHRGGAVFIEGARNVTIDQCRFIRTGGNALFLSGHAWNTEVRGSEFFLIGDSAIATVGDIKLNDGVSSSAYPRNTVIIGNHFHEIGITGKQSSALFSATSCRTTFAHNVAYNGPRAGVNLNDAFCHGHRIASNVLFNWVRETQDHGPINTWNRAAYIYRGVNGATTVPEWTHIESNLIMNGPSGNRDLGNLFPTIDNDDGSAYFSAEGNVLIYGGAKNYLGHDKRWANNLLIFPDRWSGNPCAQLWGGENHFYINNECVLGGNLSAQNIPDPLGLDGTRKGFQCLIDPANSSNRVLTGHTENNVYYTIDGQFRMGCGSVGHVNHNWTLSELQSVGIDRGSVVKSAAELSADTLDQKARLLLSL